MNINRLIQPAFGLILALLLLAGCGANSSISSGQVKGVLSYQEEDVIPDVVCLAPTGEEITLTASWSAEKGFEFNTSLQSPLERISNNSYSFLID